MKNSPAAKMTMPMRTRGMRMFILQTSQRSDAAAAHGASRPAPSDWRFRPVLSEFAACAYRARPVTAAGCAPADAARLCAVDGGAANVEPDRMAAGAQCQPDLPAAEPRAGAGA